MAVIDWNIFSFELLPAKYWVDKCIAKIQVFFFCITVDDGAILDAVFENFTHTPPHGYDGIMVEKSLLEND